tara:strand:+ start:329 stop:490 length:162 start_codon:yes stop_codon:yes gene_type:complete
MKKQIILSKNDLKVLVELAEFKEYLDRLNKKQDFKTKIKNDTFIDTNKTVGKR